MRIVKDPRTGTTYFVDEAKQTHLDAAEKFRRHNRLPDLGPRVRPITEYGPEQGPTTQPLRVR